MQGYDDMGGSAGVRGYECRGTMIWGVVLGYEGMNAGARGY